MDLAFSRSNDLLLPLLCQQYLGFIFQYPPECPAAEFLSYFFRRPLKIGKRGGKESFRGRQDIVGLLYVKNHILNRSVKREIRFYSTARGHLFLRHDSSKVERRERNVKRGGRNALVGG